MRGPPKHTPWAMVYLRLHCPRVGIEKIRDFRMPARLPSYFFSIPETTEFFFLRVFLGTPPFLLQCYQNHKELTSIINFSSLHSCVPVAHRIPGCGEAAAGPSVLALEGNTEASWFNPLILHARKLRPREGAPQPASDSGLWGALDSSTPPEYALGWAG